MYADGGTQGIRTLTPPVKSRVLYLLSKRPASLISGSFMDPSDLLASRAEHTSPASLVRASLRYEYFIV
jgi:hypothetical protein